MHHSLLHDSVSSFPLSDGHACLAEPSENEPIGILQTGENRCFYFNIQLAAIIVSTCNTAYPRVIFCAQLRQFRDSTVLQ